MSYSFLKQALQTAGLVKKHRARGRRRREPRACFGEPLHIDGSPHAWLALRPSTRAVLIAVLDDATKQVVYAQLWARETTVAIMTALREVITTRGLPMAVYTDRAHWAFHTPHAGGPVDKRRLTQVGRALDRLGIEHIVAYSPQARGRSERLNRTFQDRLVNGLRVAKITTLETANTYLRERFVPDYNATFQCAPANPATAFVALGSADIDQILRYEDERIVAPDNTVTSQVGGPVRAVACSPVAISRARSRFGRGRTVSADMQPSLSGPVIGVGRSSLWKLPEPWTHRPRPPLLGKRQTRVFHSYRRPQRKSGQITCQTKADRSLVSNSRQARGASPLRRLAQNGWQAREVRVRLLSHGHDFRNVAV